MDVQHGVGQGLTWQSDPPHLRSRGAAPPLVPHEDPAVADVERILAAAGSTHRTSEPLREAQPVADNVLWICACVTIDDGPIWLIYDTPTGGLAWRRVPDRIEPLELVKA